MNSVEVVFCGVFWMILAGAEIFQTRKINKLF